jgi:hypothetical protein
MTGLPEARASTMQNFKVFCVLAIAAAIGLTWPAVAAAEDHQWPRFRSGMWQFERTMTAIGDPGKGEQSSYVIFKREMTRCVDPSEAMRETFRGTSVGNCRSSRPERYANKYVFPRRCDYMGPVRTTIVVESETAYTEINELHAGALPRTDTVIARRIASCN